MAISVKKSVSVTGQGPFQYLWSSTSSCVQFDRAAGTTNGVFTTEALFVNESCFSTAVITLTVTSSCGTSVTQTVSFSNPCTSVVVDGPRVSGPLTFTAGVVSTGCTTASFMWSYDTALFRQVSLLSTGLTSTLVLALKVAKVPASTPIRVGVVDCKDCVKESTLSYLFCTPFIDPVTIYLFSDALDEDYVSGSMALNAPKGCSDFTVDWSTVQLLLPQGISHQVDNLGNVVLTGTSSLSQGNLVGSYVVSGINGVVSQAGKINIVLIRTVDAETVVLQDQVYVLDCEDVPGSVIDIPFSYVVSPGVTIDWSSFVVVTPPIPRSNSIVLGFDNQGNRVVKYTVPNPASSDTFAISICDTEGGCASAALYTVAECAPAPVAVNDTYTVTCGSTTSMSVLSNDISAGSSLLGSSLAITKAPDYGQVVVNNQGVVSYTANSNYAGTDTFKYTVRNARGVVSNEATVTITVVCAGTDIQIAICN